MRGYTGFRVSLCNLWRQQSNEEMRVGAVQRQTAVTAYFSSKQLLLLAFVFRSGCLHSGTAVTGRIRARFAGLILIRLFLQLGCTR